MATLTLRSQKGSPLTNQEVDDNFSNLNSSKLEVSGGTLTGPLSVTILTSSNVNGDEGGKLLLAKPATNTTIDTSVTVKLYQNKLQIFETGGLYRGAHLDITTSAADIGSKILTSSNINSYAPTLTGVGASGTWGINISGNSATVTSITSSQVTSALGYTPYNSSNPSGYITGYTETDTLATVTGRGATTSTAVTLSADSNRVGNLYVGYGTYKNSITPVGDSNMNLDTPSGAVYVTTSIRSPIFYDSNDTGYYGDFNNGGIKAWRNSGYSGGISVADTGGYLTYRITTNNHSDGWQWQFTTNDITSGSGTKSFWVTYSGSNAYAAGSMRAPIFYDLDDTGYYTDPASTSVINILDARNTARISYAGYAGIEYYNTPGGQWQAYIGTESNSGNLRFNSYNGNHNWYSNSSSIATLNSTRLRLGSPNGNPASSIVSSLNRYLEIAVNDANSTSYTYGSGVVFHHGGVSTSALSYMQPNADGGYFNFASDDSSFAGTISASSMRAPIFYDSDNTAYYYDGAGTTRVNTLRIMSNGSADWDAMSLSTDGANGYIQGLGDETGLHIRSEYGNIYLADNRGDVRMPMFYDVNDTGYYVNPNGTSLVSALFLEGLNNNRAIGKTHSGSDFGSGTLVTTNIPATGWAGASFVLECTGKSYSSSPPFSFMVQGYLYSDTIINCSGIQHATPLSYIRVFESGGVLCFWWPRWSYWNSFEVRVRDAGGDSANRVTNITDSALPSGNKMVTVTLFNTAIYGFNNNVGALYTTVLYDSNDTGYYVDPNSNSKLINLGLGGATPDVQLSVNGTAHIGGSSTLYMGGTAGSYNSWGSRDYTSGSSRYFNANYFEFNNYGYGSTWSYSISGGVGQISSSWRAPIFYDSDDTGYYLDPNSTSNSALRIRGGALHGPNPTWGAYLLVGGDGRQGYVDNGSTASVCTTNGNLHLDSASGYNSYINWYDGTDLIVGAGDSSSERLRVYGSSNYTQATGSLRSPIFYDSDDTNYYLNPNSTSNLNNLLVSGRYVKVKSGDIGTGIYNTGWYTIASYGNGRCEDTLVISDQDSSRHNFVKVNIVWSFGHGGVTVVQSGRHGASTIRHIRLMYNTSNQTYGGVLVQVYCENPSWTLYVHSEGQGSPGWGTMSIYGTAVQEDSPSGWAQYSRIDDINDQARLATTGYITSQNEVYAYGSLRSPIFYDSNNTGYYVDPASTTNLNVVAVQRAYAGYDAGVTNSFSCSDWFRSSGNTGWYNASYGGGIYMEDTTWVRVYNNKAFYVNNQIAATGNVTAYYSDERLKTKVGIIDNALAKVCSLEGFLYINNDLAKANGYNSDKIQVALSAQQVQRVQPEVVSLAPFDMHTDELTGEITSKSGENYLTIDYAKLVPLLIEAVKEQQQQIEQQQQQINTLTELVKNLANKPIV